MQKQLSIMMSLAVIAMMLFAAAAVAKPDHGKRVIAHTAEEVAAALAEGCEIVRETHGMTALLCPPDAGANLQEDIRVFKQDAPGNIQIKANLVHTAGNTGAGRTIAVLDTGYNYNHVDLSSSYKGGTDLVNNDNDPLDDEGHGSHVAGIITGDGLNSNAKGVAPGAGVIAVKVLDAQGSGFFSDVVAGIYWVVDGPDGTPSSGDEQAVDAISMSIGTSAPYLYKFGCDTVYPDLTTAINYARSKGILVVVAAGNSGSAGVSLPGCIGSSFTVGAVDDVDRIASFSGRGTSVDVSAPGVTILSTVLGQDYASFSGTSMATPATSGTVALIKSAHPGYSISQVETSLTKTAKDLGKKGKDTSYGWGRIDAQAAVNYNA